MARAHDPMSYDSASARQATRLDDIAGRFDPWLVGIIVAIATLGVIMVASSSIAIGEDLDVGRYHFLTRHLMFLAIGLALAVTVMRTELKTVEKYDRFLLLGCVGLLLLVFVPGLGRSVNGAHRWIWLGVSNFQVVEAVKVIYIVWLASYLVRFRDDVNATWGAMLKPIGVAVVLVALLLLQPDFGSSMLLLGVTGGMLVLGGGHLQRMMLPVIGLLPLVIGVAVLEPYRMRRITSFMNPWEDQLGAGYQLSNALMAVGRGEFSGVGLGASVQKLSYLPEAHTDFIFSVLAEELGFLGVCLVIGLFVALVGRALWVGLKCVEMRRHFAGYCAFGVALMIGMQSLVSIGVNLGLLPTKGLTLPLVSSGGSSVMMTCVAMGLLLRVSYELDRAQRQVARLRGDAAAPAPAGPVPPTTQPPLPVQSASLSRGTSRLQQRVEPSFGGRSNA
ncbi:putative lipid II flippase FtsW [Luteimonas terrae]|uniref:Probable peptidoglycan glycosyltransferase FtsW n=1 Tax=Luteimonas terrae TaxID=1530191 RepID=A0A4R5U6Z9_9GAMM|nr:putative lipid II flippase FtsW [Luteimonas terrae]TDK30035.1 putative lipid II flippase FtsW [Luteimonas terrae]